MGDYNFSGAVTALISVGLLIGLATWGLFELIDYLFIDDAIRVTQPLKPEIELTIKDNIVDTIYVYRIK